MKAYSKTITRSMSPKLDAPEDRKTRFMPALVPLKTLADTFTGQVSGTPQSFVGKQITLDVVISDQARVLIEGRANPTLHWITVAAFTTSQRSTIPALTELRATVTDNTGSVSVFQHLQ